MFDSLPWDGCIVAEQQWGSIMAKRKKRGKLPKRAKRRRGNSAARPKPRKVAKSAKATKRTTKPKRAPVKKAARRMKQPVAPATETVSVETIERPVAITEIVEVEVREVGPGRDEPEPC